LSSLGGRHQRVDLDRVPAPEIRVEMPAGQVACRAIPFTMKLLEFDDVSTVSRIW
jgi:hypothetical protein